MITLGNAAKALNISKPALSKAISRGHLSATKRPDGSFAIDPAELARWWEGAKHRFQAPPVLDLHGTTPSPNGGNGADDPLVKLAAAEETIKGLRDLLEEMRRSREQTETDRDRWREQAQSIKALLAPAEKPSLLTRAKKAVGWE